MRRLAALALLVLGGCSSRGGHDVELTVSINSTIKDSDVAAIKRLDLSATGPATDSHVYTLDRPLRRTERLVVHATASGMLTLAAMVRDADNLIVARGSVTVMLGGGSAHQASLTLSPLPGGKRAATSLKLSPTSYSMFVGQTVPLDSGTDAVVWSTSDGGSVSAEGRYTAPATAGTYHVGAQSKVYLTDTADVTLTVLANGIAHYAGHLGGAGATDGVGAAARINNPPGMVYDGRSTVYFSDQTSVIRKLDVDNGTVTTIAGQPDKWFSADGVGPDAGFKYVNGIAWDGADTLYIAEGGCPCVRKLVISTATVTTLSGKLYNGGTKDGVGPDAQWNWPNDLAFDAANHRLFVADRNANTIRTVDVTSGNTVTWAGLGDTAGNVDGARTDARFRQPQQVTIDGSGKVYVYDFGNAAIRVLDPASNKVSSVSGRIETPSLAWDGAGHVLLASPLRQIDVSTGAVSDMLDTHQEQIWGWFQDFTVGMGSTLFVGEDWGISRWDSKTGDKVFIAGLEREPDKLDGPRPLARFPLPSAIAVRADGAVYVRDNNALRRIDPATGGVSTVLQASNARPFSWENGGMKFGPDGRLYMAERAYHTILAIDVDKGTATTVVGQDNMPGAVDGDLAQAKLNRPADVVFEGGLLYITDADNHTVRVVDLTKKTIGTLAGTTRQCGYLDMPGTQAQLCNPDGIAGDGHGILYVTSSGSVRKVVIAGAGVTTLAGGAMNGVGAGQIAAAGKLALDPTQRYLYLIDFEADLIRRIEVATGTMTIAAGAVGSSQIVTGPLPGAVNRLQDLVFLPSGDLLALSAREQGVIQIRFP
jgi:sugar lactone lactonase YvrE